MHHGSGGNCSVLKAKVNPSQRSTEHNHEAWVIIGRKNGSVKTGYCMHLHCMTGYVNIVHMLMLFIYIFHRLEEVCSHVVTLLFNIEAANRLGYTRPSSTSLPCQ